MSPYLKKRLAKIEKEIREKRKIEDKKFLDSWIRPGSVLRQLFDREIIKTNKEIE